MTFDVKLEMTSRATMRAPVTSFRTR